MSMTQKRHKSLDSFLANQMTDDSFRTLFEAERIKLRIARWIKAARTQRGWSQAELARLASTTQPVIARLESASDEREPSLSLLGRLAEALGFQLALSFEKPRRQATTGRRAASPSSAGGR